MHQSNQASLDIIADCPTTGSYLGTGSLDLLPHHTTGHTWATTLVGTTTRPRKTSWSKCGISRRRRRRRSSRRSSSSKVAPPAAARKAGPDHPTALARPRSRRAPPPCAPPPCAPWRRGEVARVALLSCNLWLRGEWPGRQGARGEAEREGGHMGVEKRWRETRGGREEERRCQAMR